MIKIKIDYLQGNSKCTLCNDRDEIANTANKHNRSPRAGMSRRKKWFLRNCEKD